MPTVARRELGRLAKPEAGVVYRTACQNPGCGHAFDLRITPENAGLLSGTMACPQCRRHGGMLKREVRLGDRLFSAKLVFRMTGVAPRADEDEVYSGTAELRY
ncbi:MAG: hypothetical protein ACREQ4_00900 [Candidatus Binataceae bacterium]